MKKSGTYFFYGSALIFMIFLVYVIFGLNNKNESSENNINAQVSNSKSEKTEQNKLAEKIQVYEFHSTNRCYSCITMGQYIKDTLEESFQPELRDGKIDFREINVDLPENKDLATKFKAAGTSLFFNPIIDGQDNIQEEVQAWRLLGNKKAFSDYLVKKIRGMIGEAVSAEVKKEIESKDITFYTSDDCQSCENIEKYFAENDIKNKVAFEEKNVDKNETDAEQMAEDAMHCDIDPESFGVPFLWAEGKCYTEEKAILDYFKQKIK